MNAQEEGCIITSQGAEDSLYEAMQMGIICTRKLLYFELSPPWHLYVLLLANLLAFYLTYLLEFFWHFIWHIFWHSIWHIFWHSTWHIFCNMFWHIFWHSIWHIFWHIFWHSIWHSIWQIFWHMFWQTFWHFIWHTFWHSIWHSIWHTSWHSIWHSIWHIFWCPLSSEGPRFRSSGAQCAQTLAVEVQQWPLRAEVGEELGEELARRKWTWKWRQRWWRRTRRRRKKRRRTTPIKSNNPHLAGGEKYDNQQQTGDPRLLRSMSSGRAWCTTRQPLPCQYHLQHPQLDTPCHKFQLLWRLRQPANWAGMVQQATDFCHLAAF